ncbi:transcription initiation factor IID- 31kD subunit-domain-containing protein [Apiospora rasikravindrae]|uniref:Transcription initiation factor IID- 31kD subunit-domain-containing protein n=1 Tax=Apiospora rasikravindrae TaxID=990691 RepID=A0ABR1TAG8_9PEZI
MATASQSQPNGIPSSSAASGPSQSQSQPTQATTSSTLQASSQATGGAAAPSPSAPNGAPSTSAPRPRDARTIELLLTSQGVTSYDSRVPLLLLDFAYRHTSSVLSDALHLTTDPYTSAAGSKPSGASGAAPSAPANIDAAVSTNAVSLAVASRQAYQFRGGSGAGGSAGGGASKDWLMELAKERNRVALPRVHAHEWGVRLPNERFVLSGMSWGLKDRWGGNGGEGMDDDDDEDESEPEGGMEDAMEGVETLKQEGTDAAKDSEGGLGEMLEDDMADDDEDMDLE